MVVRVTFVGFPGLETGEAELELSGATLDALLAAVGQTLGITTLRAICHEGHTVDAGVMVLRNDARVDSRDLRLADGDRISFVRMVAGG